MNGRDGFIAVVAALALLAPHAPAVRASPGPASPGDPARDRALGRLLAAAYGPDHALADGGGRDLFEAVLARPVFRHAAVGPFDLYVYESGPLAKGKEGREALADAAAGLAAAAAVIERRFGHGDGLVAGRRFPIVLASSAGATGSSGTSDAAGADAGGSYAEVVALLDRCEDDGLSGWKPANAVWTTANLGAEVTRTWEAQVFDLAHKTIASQGKAWFDHGIGYYALAHVANRLLRQGAWGNAPPWLAQGLIDELDIEAYGEAWVGGDWWESSTAGWSRPGWSGFVPQGAQPPPPVTGPPADLAVTVKKTGNRWEQREASGQRHWSDLVADRKSEAPASFAFMAQNESFFPRDRAYARCALNLVLDVAAPEQGGLLPALDRKPGTSETGMPEGDPLPAAFARALGGIAEVDALEAQGLQAMLATIGRDDIAQRIRALDASGMLDIADHRDQARWLLEQPRFDQGSRDALFQLILEAEYYQQLREWELIGRRLDAATTSALAACGHYPKAGKDREKVAEAFHAALAAP